MSRDRKKNDPPADAPKRPLSPATPPAAAKLTGWKLWRFRLAAAVGIPFTILLLAEFGLLAGGFGYPPHFLLPLTDGGRELLVQNNRFGWRFFGPAMAREPDSFAIARNKPPGTIRVFVFGESAAFGDPEPAFGVCRMLQAMLELRHPGVKFEVINAAMTGINSNVILPIARDCAQADGDVWVVYMGNNEVVGPFGSGTVFGPQSASISLIRSSLAFKATRLGQLFDSLNRRLHPPPASKSEWGGMEMFLDQQVRADDPRMNAVYDNFQRNLADIIEAGERHGAGIVVSTVAVNLKDSGPFASAHRPGLAASDLEVWKQDFQRGTEAQTAGKFQEAAERFREAAKIDDSFAELRFRQGVCDVALGDAAAARTDFAAARDLDTLRFRCDTRLNDLIRKSVVGGTGGHVLLADAEQAFAEQSTGGLPGQDYFYEHVHLTFEGNYLLAKTVAPQVEKLLVDKVKAAPGDAAWPSADDCARRLARTDWKLQSAWSDILDRLRDPPFNSQVTHEVQVAYAQARLEALAAGVQPAGISNALQVCSAASAAAPDDPVLHGQLAELKQMIGDLAGAEADARKAVELLPASAADWSQLGLVLGRRHQYEGAADAFERAFQLDPEDVWTLQNLAEAYMKMDRRDDAIREYKRAVEIKPRFGLGWLGLGKAMEEAGDKAEAEKDYRLAITNRIHRPQELVALAQFCRDRGWFEESSRVFDEAVTLTPGDSLLRTNAMTAHFEYGRQLGQTNLDLALAQFRESVRLTPDFPNARLNLGIALVQKGNYAEALAQIEEFLRLSPDNDPNRAVAQKYLDALRGQTNAPPEAKH